MWIGNGGEGSMMVFQGGDRIAQKGGSIAAGVGAEARQLRASADR